jgi:uncharacterized protein (TIGR02147 family)
MKEQTDYRDTLREVLESRCAKNMRYSLRSFARDLGISPSRLSDVLNGRYGLSPAAAKEIAEKLPLEPEDMRRFCDQVESMHARNKAARSAAQERIRNNLDSYRNIQEDGLDIISEWYYLAILELCLTEGFQSSPAWISRALGVNVHLITGAIQRLKKLNYLREDPVGNLSPTENFTAGPATGGKPQIHRFHGQVTGKALEALEFHPIQERAHCSIIMAFNSEQMEEAKTELREFVTRFDKKFGASPVKDQVYCLNLQFFRLQESSGEIEN